MTGRIVVDSVHPSTPNRYPAKAVVGEAVRVTADVFKDGHDTLAARVRWRLVGGRWESTELHETVNDGWEGIVRPSEVGLHEFVVEAWTDRYSTWRHRVTTKLSAGQEVDLELEEGARLLESRRPRPRPRARPRAGSGAATATAATATASVGGAATAGAIDAAVGALRDKDASALERLAPALDAEVAAAMAGPQGSPDLTRSAAFRLQVDRPLALRGAWYELFPRSEGGFRGAGERLAAVADMGFDIVYLPPIHPIGLSFRKGRNNTLVAGPDDPGSPWAIGSEAGGHDAIHPDLGDEDDLRAFMARAGELGLEVALDYALQCSPDHPWVRDHPEWFHLRPDGSIAYAENPPKRYQDIFPINFWPEREEDRVALWEACRDVLMHWMGFGLRIFRVDNPHTKPIAFWEWLIPEIQAVDPGVILLAEAFTRPKVMARLAEVGFSQSYTYFTWRNTAEELREYVTELTQGPMADYMRPNFWPNTPDILSGALRDGPLSAFRMRLVLAATLVPSYGIYSGYELGENDPASETNEEYLYSEKYELRERDWDDPESIAPFIGLINAVRRRHPAFDWLRNVTFHQSAHPGVLAYSKHTDDLSDVMLMVVNLDPHVIAETTLWIDLAALGLPWDQPYEAHDELSGRTFLWNGPDQYIRLDPAETPAHILHLRRA